MLPGLLATQLWRHAAASGDAVLELEHTNSRSDDACGGGTDLIMDPSIDLEEAAAAIGVIGSAASALTAVTLAPRAESRALSRECPVVWGPPGGNSCRTFPNCAACAPSVGVGNAWAQLLQRCHVITPLHLAALHGNLEATEQLLSAGAQPMVSPPRFASALHVAIALGHADVAVALA